MNQHVNAISNRLSLRAPQRTSLEILARVADILSLEKGADAARALKAIQAEFPTVADFERDFPSLCFALIIGDGSASASGAAYGRPAAGRTGPKTFCSPDDSGSYLSTMARISA